MRGTYTCPYCREQYLIKESGSYICECGEVFHFPAELQNVKNNHSASEAVMMDTDTSMLNRSGLGIFVSTRKMRFIIKENCIYARAALICGVLGLIFFGIPSIAALILGITGKNVIEKYRFYYKGAGMAKTGTVLGVIGLIVWGTIFLSLI